MRQERDIVRKRKGANRENERESVARESDTERKKESKLLVVYFKICKIYILYLLAEFQCKFSIEIPLEKENKVYIRMHGSWAW
jgi:hypothetical protein